MTRIDRLSPWSARALPLLLLLLAVLPSVPALAATSCVNTVAEFINAYEDVQDDEQTINVVTGTYTFNVGTGLVHDLDHDFEIVGGWNANCTSRQSDPRLTVFTGPAEFDIINHDDIRIESIAFVDTGYLLVHARSGSTLGEDKSIRLERVWFENVCGGDGRCGDRAEHPIVLSSENVQFSQVVVTDNRAAGCAVVADNSGLVRMGVAYSVFAGNASRGLCVRRSGGGGAEDYELSIINSIFWDNLQGDILTRDSPLISLRNNILQSRDSVPPTSIQPLQNLGVDPQFQNQAGHDFRLQASSPAINTGRFLPYVTPQDDLDGGDRVIGAAPDRGAFESASTESTFLVTNTVDTTSPVGPGSLRWAIEQANETPGLDRIRFALPGCPRIIELNAPLPDITDSVFIDGYSQAGSAKNTLQRSFQPTLCVGLRDASLALDHALRIPAGVGDDTLLWVSGLAFGGFDVAAVRIAGGSGSWVFGNQFAGSLGGTALGNNAVNVRIGGTSHDNLVGGIEDSQRNLIASAYVAGVELLDNSGGDEGFANTVRNNFIGLRSNGTEAAGNALGVRVRTRDNEIVDNFISGNQGDGILIEGPLAVDNDIRDNAIGLKTFAFCLPPCTPDIGLGNIGAGIRLSGDGDDNDIVYNRIAYNGGAGVRLEDGVENVVWSNSITANDGLGIDLGAAGTNPVYNQGLAGSSALANRGVNAPTVSSASGSGTGGTASGLIVGRNGSYLVQFFSNASCDASGRGEGSTLVTTESVVISNQQAGANGSASFNFALPASANLDGRTLTATLIDDVNNTSEFSSCRAYQTLQCQRIFSDGLEDNPPPSTCTPL